ncbi:MAG: glycosyltransferase family 9 protein [Fusobacteriota bacterium]
MNILVIRFSSIGDIILTTPILEAIKKKYPDSRLDFLTFHKYKETVMGNKNINNLILFKKDKYKGVCGIYKFSKKLEKNDYDIVLDLHSKIRSKLISLFLGKKTYRYKKRQLWKTLLVKLKIIKYNSDNTIINNYFGAAQKSLGVTKKNENIKFNFSKNDLERVKKYNNYIIFAPGASKNTKKWPVDYFAELGKKFVNEGEKIALIGSKKEFHELEIINKKIGSESINLAGKLSLKESGALMFTSKWVLTNDSGPFHISRGVGAKTFVIFGPTDPNMFSYDQNSVLIYNDSNCSPCSLHGDSSCPKGNFKCMEELSSKKVYEKIKEVLNN